MRFAARGHTMPRLTGRTERIRIGRQGHRPGLQAYTRSSSRWMDLESKRITCYRDATGDLLVLPWAKVGYGGTATSHLRRLPSDAGSERLGRLVRECLTSVGFLRRCAGRSNSGGIRSVQARSQRLLTRNGPLTRDSRSFDAWRQRRSSVTAKEAPPTMRSYT